MIGYTTNYQIYNDLKLTFDDMLAYKVTGKEITKNDKATVFIFNLQPDFNLRVTINADSTFNVPILVVHKQHSLNLPLTFTISYKEHIVEAVETILNLFLPQQYQDDIIMHDEDATNTTNEIIKSITS